MVNRGGWCRPPNLDQILISGTPITIIFMLMPPSPFYSENGWTRLFFRNHLSIETLDFKTSTVMILFSHFDVYSCDLSISRVTPSRKWKVSDASPSEHMKQHILENLSLRDH